MNEPLQTSNDVLRLIDQHRFHNPLQPRTCYICKVAVYSSTNAPTAQWAKAIVRVARPPLPVAVMMLAIITCALALTMNT